MRKNQDCSVIQLRDDPTQKSGYIDGMSDAQIVRHYDRGVPKGARGAGDLLRQMMDLGALHVRDRRVGRQGHPYAQSFFRVPALGLLISQREHLSST